MSSNSRPSDFDTTHWSLVHAAASADPVVAERALAALCSTYWRPLFNYVRRQGYGFEDAQDSTQSFFVALLERHDMQRLRQERGRLRSFFLASLRNFLLNDVVRGNAQRRGGGVVPLSLESGTPDASDIHEPADPDTPETIFDRDWALALLESVLDEERKEWAATGEAHLFDLLRPCVLGDLPPGGYRSLALDLNATEGAAKMTVKRLRSGFHERLREVIADTLLTDPDDPSVDEEIRYLLQILRA